MGWISGIFVYVVIWWVVLFAVLPWGVKVPDEPEPGHATSAPTNPRLGLKMLITSAVALIVWLGLYLVMEAGWIRLSPGEGPT